MSSGNNYGVSTLLRHKYKHAAILEMLLLNCHLGRGSSLFGRKTFSRPSWNTDRVSHLYSSVGFNITPANGFPFTLSLKQLKRRYVPIPGEWIGCLFLIHYHSNIGLHLWLGSSTRSRQCSAIPSRMECRLRCLVYLQVPECGTGSHRRFVRPR